MQFIVIPPYQECWWGISVIWRISERWALRRAKALQKQKACSSWRHLHLMLLMFKQLLRSLSGKSTTTSAGKSWTLILIKLNCLWIEWAWSMGQDQSKVGWIFLVVLDQLCGTPGFVISLDILNVVLLFFSFLVWNLMPIISSPTFLPF